MKHLYTKISIILTAIVIGLMATTGCDSKSTEAGIGTLDLPLSVGDGCDDRTGAGAAVDGECYDWQSWIRITENYTNTTVTEFATPDGSWVEDWDYETSAIPVALAPLPDGFQYCIELTSTDPCELGAYSSPEPVPGCYRLWDCSSDNPNIPDCTEIQDEIVGTPTFDPVCFTIENDESTSTTLFVDFLDFDLLFGYGILDVKVDVEELTCDPGYYPAKIVDNTDPACYFGCNANTDCVRELGDGTLCVFNIPDLDDVVGGADPAGLCVTP